MRARRARRHAPGPSSASAIRRFTGGGDQRQGAERTRGGLPAGGPADPALLRALPPLARHRRRSARRSAACWAPSPDRSCWAPAPAKAPCAPAARPIRGALFRHPRPAARRTALPGRAGSGAVAARWHADVAPRPTDCSAPARSPASSSMPIWWCCRPATRPRRGGAQFGGGALEGLADSFFEAGARAVLASHWEVPSAATRQLMTGVFARYAKDPSRDLAEALRQAQLALIANRRPPIPFNWAAFTLIGDTGNMAHTGATAGGAAWQAESDHGDQKIFWHWRSRRCCWSAARRRRPACGRRGARHRPQAGREHRFDQAAGAQAGPACHADFATPAPRSASTGPITSRRRPAAAAEHRRRRWPRSRTEHNARTGEAGVTRGAVTNKLPEPWLRRCHA